MFAVARNPHRARLWRLLAPLGLGVVLLALTPAWGLLRNWPKLERAASLAGTALPNLVGADPGMALPTLSGGHTATHRHLLAYPNAAHGPGWVSTRGFPGKPLRLFLTYGRLLLEGA